MDTGKNEVCSTMLDKTDANLRQVFLTRVIQNQETARSGVQNAILIS